jgi:predicted aconitase
MSIKHTALAAVLALTAAGAAQADALRSIEARSIDLGAVSGVAYYTVEPDGLRVVATLAEGEDGTPVRVEALLAAGQSVVISSPREAGAPANRVEIARAGDGVLVSEVALTD